MEIPTYFWTEDTTPPGPGLWLRLREWLSAQVDSLRPCGDFA